jgi:hypothetical protein
LHAGGIKVIGGEVVSAHGVVRVCTGLRHCHLNTFKPAKV